MNRVKCRARRATARQTETATERERDSSRTTRGRRPRRGPRRRPHLLAELAQQTGPEGRNPRRGTDRRLRASRPAPVPTRPRRRSRARGATLAPRARASLQTRPPLAPSCSRVSAEGQTLSSGGVLPGDVRGAQRTRPTRPRETRGLGTGGPCWLRVR